MGTISLIMWQMERTLITRAIRFILSLLDGVVYYFISSVMQAIFDISSMPFEKDLLNGLTAKLYVILSVFMLFKIGVSLISYLVNPDTITDKQQGTGKLISRVIITMLMLIALPLAFDELMSEKLNNGILQTLPKLLIGTDFIEDAEMDEMADTISWAVLSGFIQNNMECQDSLDKGLGPRIEEVTVEEDYNTTRTLDPSKKKPTTTQVLDNINLACKSNGDEYHYEYTPLMSTAAGVFLLYVLIGIAINVGVRAFKLMILRIIAPIPILSYIDPKAGKDGPFNKWLKMLINTWLELYLHLAIVYFVVYLLAEIINNDESETIRYFSNLGIERGIYAIIFITLGLFFFAKQAPKFIADSLGMKSDGFGDIFKMAGAGVGVGAAAGAMLGAGAANFRASRLADNALGRRHSLLRNVGAGLFGAGAAGIAGASASLNAKDHNSRAAVDAIRKRNAAAISRGAGGSTFMGRMIEGANQYFGGETRYDALQRQVAAEDSYVKDSEAYLGALKSEAIKGKYGAATVGSFSGHGTYNNVKGNSKDLRTYTAQATANGDKFVQFNGHTIDIRDADGLAAQLEKAEMELLHSQIMSGAHDADLPDLVDAYFGVRGQAEYLGYGDAGYNSRANIDAHVKSTKAASGRTKRSSAFSAGKANADAVKK